MSSSPSPSATNPKAAPRAFLPHVHSFRAVAIVAVVVTHVTDYLDWQSSSTLVRDVSYSIFQNGSVMFVFIAGLLFQYLSTRFRYSRYLLTKLKYVVCPYVLTSLPALAHQYLRGYGVFGPAGLHGPVWQRIVVSLFTAAHMPRPLWFIPMIVVFYVLAPVFLLWDRHPRAYTLLGPLLIMSGFAHRPTILNSTFHAFLYFLPSYIAGMMAGHYHAALLQWLKSAGVRAVLWLGFASLLAVEVIGMHRGGAVFSSRPFGDPWAFDINQPAKLLLSLAILGLLASASTRAHQRMSLLAETSFGVFFVHEYVLFSLDKIVSGPLRGSVLILAAATTIALSLTLALVLVVRRLTGKWSRYFVGC